MVSQLLSQLNSVAIQLKAGSRKPGQKTADLGIAEHAVLEIVSRTGAVTVPQIARERSTSRQNIQILVDRLRAEGRVVLGDNPAHKRSALVRLTDKGRTWLRDAEPDRQRLMSEICSKLSQSEIEITLSALRKVVSLFSNGIVAQPDSAKVAFPTRKETLGNSSKEQWAEPLEGGQAEFPVNLL